MPYSTIIPLIFFVALQFHSICWQFVFFLQFLSVCVKFLCLCIISVLENVKAYPLPVTQKVKQIDPPSTPSRSSLQRSKVYRIPEHSVRRFEPDTRPKPRIQQRETRDPSPPSSDSDDDFVALDDAGRLYFVNPYFLISALFPPFLLYLPVSTLFPVCFCLTVYHNLPLLLKGLSQSISLMDIYLAFLSSVVKNRRLHLFA